MVLRATFTSPLLVAGTVSLLHAARHEANRGARGDLPLESPWVDGDVGPASLGRRSLGDVLQCPEAVAGEDLSSERSSFYLKLDAEIPTTSEALIVEVECGRKLVKVHNYSNSHFKCAVWLIADKQ